MSASWKYNKDHKHIGGPSSVKGDIQEFKLMVGEIDTKINFLVGPQRVGKDWNQCPDENYEFYMDINEAKHLRDKLDEAISQAQHKIDKNK